jgi:hypothetical protein
MAAVAGTPGTFNPIASLNVMDREAEAPAA